MASPSQAAAMAAAVHSQPQTPYPVAAGNGGIPGQRITPSLERESPLSWGSTRPQKSQHKSPKEEDSPRGWSLLFCHTLLGAAPACACRSCSSPCLSLGDGAQGGFGSAPIPMSDKPPCLAWRAWPGLSRELHSLGSATAAQLLWLWRRDAPGMQEGPGMTWPNSAVLQFPFLEAGRGTL